MKDLNKKSLFSFFLLLLGGCSLFAQQAPAATVQDTTRKVHILNNTRNLTFQTIDDSTKLTIVTGDVKLRQGTALFYCDSCVINQRTNIFEAWGKVHINDADTANVYANHLRYLANRKIAYLDGNVRMTDGQATLTTPDLEYDMQTNLGTYKNGGRVVNKKTVLTSKEGFYYADLKDIYFKRNVKLRDTAYTIDTDSLLYNTESKTTRFISETIIKDSSGRVIKTREGFYNQQTGKAEFASRPEIYDGSRIITAIRIAFDDSTGIYQAEGNAVVRDTAEGTTIIGGLIYQNKKTDAVLATRKPLMIIKQEKDSIYVTADTLFSARLTDKFGDRNMRLAEMSGGRKLLTFAAESPEPDTAVTKSLDKLPPETLVVNDSLSTRVREKKLISLAKPDVIRAAKTDSTANPGVVGRSPEQRLASVDTVKKEERIVFAEKDSTNRYFEAYSHVRIFSDSMQSVCDSMFYSFKDSVFRLYKNPVVWANNSQVTGDTILLFTKNKKADKVEAYENSFLVNRIENEVYNQIKSSRMDGWFVECKRTVLIHI